MQSWLSWFLRGILILGFLLLVGRTVELQVIKGSYYRTLSEENRIKRVPITAARGRILARGGEVMDGSDFAHITGYLGEVNENEVGKVNPKCPEKGPRYLGQMVGKVGLQLEYNCLLEGTDGEELVEVTSTGANVRTLGVRHPVPGKDLTTTIDYGLQKEVAKDLDKKGAVVVSDPKGQILALFSYPSYNPEDVAVSLKDPDLPFFNRAISGLYHPGSTFKPVVAVAALEAGVIDKNFVFDDPGVITVNGFNYGNWYFSQYGGREGAINLVRAITRSTDTFFYKIGEMVGPDTIAQWAQKFGLDKPTGIDLSGEASGLIPTPEWKVRIKGENWFLGNTYHMAIGQGDVSVTPVEVNNFISTIANGGYLCKDHIGMDVKEDCKSINVEKNNLELVKQGMIGVCAAGGTGYTFFDFKSDILNPVACKTGTAQTSGTEETHAWFTLFAPAEMPQIVMTAIVEKGGEGSKVGGPIARSIMDYWNLRNNP